MGYRSDVKFVFYTNDPDTLPFAAIKLWVDENYPKHVAVNEWGATIEETNTAILISYESVKWYDSYGHPQAVKAALELFDATFDEGLLAAWEEMIVGEELEDNAHAGSAHHHYRLALHREIIFN
jgi:hypothetical protein